MGVSAFGTVLQIGDGAATEIFTTVSQIRDVAGGGDTVDTEDVTHHASAREEIVATIVRNSEMTVNVLYNPQHATHGTGGLRGDLAARTLRNFLLYTPGSTGGTTSDKLAFAAYVTAIQPNYPLTGAINADVTLRISGASTYTTSATTP